MKFISAFLAIVFILLSGSSLLAEDLVIAQNPSELITPASLNPVSIESVALRRGIISGEPVRNMIIFSGSGITGGTDALYSAFRGTRRRQMEEFEVNQTIGPVWASVRRQGQRSIIELFKRIGKPTGVISNHNFKVSGAVTGKTSRTRLNICGFSLAISFSDTETKEKRQNILSKVTQEFPEDFALNMSQLEKLFSTKGARITSLLCTKEASEDSMSLPSVMPEIIAASLSRLATKREGFFLHVEFDGVARARDNKDYYMMFKNLQLQQRILRQINSFVSARRDTLFLFIEPIEKGFWDISDNFCIEHYATDLAKAKTLAQLHQNKDEQETFNSTLLKFAGSNASKAKIKSILAETQSKDTYSTLVNYATHNHRIEFISSVKNRELSGFNLFARGYNSSVFTGLSSFDDFFMRLIAATGLSSQVNRKD